MSKAFRFHQHGGPEVLRFEDVEVGPPGPGQVRMRNVAVAVNYRDVLMRRGVHAALTPNSASSRRRASSPCPPASMSAPRRR